MSNIEPIDRAREAQQAWEMWIGGTSKREIARRLERHRNTIEAYLEEAAEWVRDESLPTKQAAIVSGHRRIIERAWEMLDSGEIKPTSLAGPQYLMQIRESLKEVARIEGLYVDKREIRHTGGTVADLARGYAEQYGDDVEAWMNGEIEDAEIVEEDIPTEQDETP